MFCVAADGDIDEYTDSVTAYISKCIDDVIPKFNVWTFPNQKPRVNGGVCAELKAQSSAYSSGDRGALRKSRYDLRRAIRRLWCGLWAITDYKGRYSSDVQPPPLSPMSSTASMHGLRWATPSLSLITADVRRALETVNPRKSRGPDGTPGRVLRGCTDQLAKVFISIFNLPH